MASSKQMFIFTFGGNQPHAGHFVRIVGTYMQARAEMIRRYGHEWGFQYTSEEWENWCKEAASHGLPVETELEDDNG